jgi:RNase P protein component
MSEAAHHPNLVIINTERISDSTLAHEMSDESILFGCTWPGCQYKSPNRDSIPTHYKTHVGQAAQRRRAKRRPRSAEVTNEVIEAALAALDMVQLLVDKVDAFDDEYHDLARKLEDARTRVEELEQQLEEWRDKAQRFDRISEAIRSDATP